MLEIKRLSSKLSMAIAPLILALVGLLAATVHAEVQRAAGEDRTAQASDFVVPLGAFALFILGVVLYVAVIRSASSRLGQIVEHLRSVKYDDLAKNFTTLAPPNSRPALPANKRIAVGGHDEIGDLAGSISDLETAFADVAAEQVNTLRNGISAMFVTLVRRNRSLIDNQLALLDEMEANVEDQQVLAGYYKLDHLSTRMRRNAESLLILANQSTQRRNSTPIDVDDVIRAGISEVDDYRRIDVLGVEPLRVVGPAVADISHLLAELLENATSFSPPDSRVRLSGSRSAGGYLILVDDSGVGIAAERFDEINKLLANPPVVGLVTKPQLGLSVVSMLAHKHGVTVRLVPTVDGVVASITLPPALEARPPEEQSPVTPMSIGLKQESPHDPHNEWTAVKPHLGALPDPSLKVGPPAAFPAPAEPPKLYQATPPISLPSAAVPDSLPVRVPGLTVPRETLNDRTVETATPAHSTRNLGAFSNGARSSTGRATNDLPTRSPNSAAAPPDVSPVSAEHQPDALRERLASFQSHSKRGRTQPDQQLVQASPTNEGPTS